MKRHYSVIGFLGADSGLAVAAKNTLHALRASGRETLEIPIEPGAQATSAVPSAEVGSDSAVNLFQLNPMEIGAYSAQWEGAIDPAGFNVCVPFWELPLVPRDWEPMLRAMDFVLAPTHYVASGCAKVVGAERVIHYPQAVFPPTGIEGDRARWGIPKDATAFIAAFDIASGIERKNPWAAIEAFQRAFPEDSAVRLVLKTRPWPGARVGLAGAERLAALAAEDDRIVLVDESLTYADVLCLYASCDAMISLHRAEGLGLHLMEAMSCGTVVVATGWSGNTDFMTEENSVPVPYELVPVDTQHPPYVPEVGREGQVWAEADIDVAAEKLRALHEDPELRRALAARAQADMEERRRSQLSGEAFDELERQLAGAAPSGPAGLTAAVSKTLTSLRMQRLRDKWSALRSRLGMRW